MDSIPGQPG